LVKSTPSTMPWRSVVELLSASIFLISSPVPLLATSIRPIASPSLRATVLSFSARPAASTRLAMAAS
jgi:hypothetical protein